MIFEFFKNRASQPDYVPSTLDEHGLPKTNEHISLEKVFKREIKSFGSEYIINDSKAFFKFRREGGGVSNVVSIENIVSQEKGQGKLLMGHLEQWCRENKIKRINIPYVLEGSEGFWKAVGFHNVGHNGNSYKDLD